MIFACDCAHVVCDARVDAVHVRNFLKPSRPFHLVVGRGIFIFVACAAARAGVRRRAADVPGAQRGAVLTSESSRNSKSRMFAGVFTSCSHGSASKHVSPGNSVGTDIGFATRSTPLVSAAGARPSKANVAKLAARTAATTTASRGGRGGCMA